MRGSSSVVERQLPKLNVAGSNPVFRSIKIDSDFSESIFLITDSIYHALYKHSYNKPVDILLIS